VGWLDIAERAGLMPDLGTWVLDESVRQAAAWIDLLGVDRAPAVHVNVSARQLDVPGFSQVVFDTVERHRLPPHQLVLELTETYLAQVSGGLVAELDALARMGIRIAADDYGTGYSPLTRIVDLPISIIKIDRQFVSPIANARRALGVVTSLVQLASTLDLEIVAEGVETAEQASILTSLGCTTAQGYLWSPAIAPVEFLRLLADRATDAMPRRPGDIRSMYLG
jgi:EAL domain-containing protein (putative c-di-GMP-specific phosphodiesterase class I)